MKKFLSAILGLVITFSLAACDNKKEEEKSNKPTIKIGVILPLTGNYANSGQSFKNATLLAQDELKKQNLKNDYTLIIDDDNFENRKTAALFHKQQSIDKVDAVISFASASGNVIAPLAEKSKIIYEFWRFR